MAEPTEEPVKPLLWLVLVVSVLVNVCASLLIPDSGAQIIASVVSGVATLGSAVSLWLLRERRTP